MQVVQVDSCEAGVQCVFEKFCEFGSGRCEHYALGCSGVGLCFEFLGLLGCWQFSTFQFRYVGFCGLWVVEVFWGEVDGLSFEVKFFECLFEACEQGRCGCV